MKYSLFKRLSNQAASSVPNDLRGCDWQLEYDKIFAELIVRECMTVARAADGLDATHEAWYLIQEHFGLGLSTKLTLLPFP